MNDRKAWSLTALLVLLVGIIVGTAVSATERFATCLGSCGCCTRLDFVNCDSCAIDENECSWSYEGCESVTIQCPPCGQK